VKPTRNDFLLALGVMALASLEIGLNDAIEPKWAALVTELPLSLSLAWRRTRPLLVLAIVALGTGFEWSLGVSVAQPLVPLLALVIGMYSVAVHEPLQRSVLGFVLVNAGLAVALVHIRGHSDITVGSFGFGTIICGGAWAAGLVVRSRTQRAGALELETERLETERAVAVAEERARIARELHDVIAHSVSVMVVQAEAAQEVLKRSPERAVEPLQAVQDTGRQAMVERSRLVGLLREEGEEIGLAPQPGLGDLDALLAQVRVAGLPVELRVEGQPRPVPLGVDLSAYRVLQEALTNALKHAGPAHAEVTVRYARDALELKVCDDGPGSGNGHVGGHGLVGMRERVSVFGGELEAGPRPEGGFVVHARLPLFTVLG
jgi:signal transduction histidine kinase